MLVRTVIQTVADRLSNASIPGIKTVEVGVLPEGRIPASFGERFLCVSAEQVMDVTNTIAGTIRRRQLRFSVSLIQRVRYIPNDRFGGVAYTDVESMGDVLDTVSTLIEHYDTFILLRTNALNNDISYGLSGAFRTENINLDPIHLYPSFFHARSHYESEESDKIAGYRMTAYFTSPVLTKSVNEDCVGRITSSLIKGYFFRPDGTSQYLRPDGSSVYLRSTT